MSQEASNNGNGNSSELPLSRIKAPDENTYKALVEFKNETGLSLAEIGRKLSIDASQVSKYINRKFEGDIVKFEAMARDVIKAHRDRSEVRALQLFRCRQSDAVRGVCEQIRKTCDVGLIYGPAGVGKSCGVEIYAAENPSAIAVTLSRWNSDYSGIERAILEQIDQSSFDRTKQRAGDFLVNRFKRSQRLFIFDNAHRLPPDSLRWVFDFSDATDCPIALVGNPEVLDSIRENDQMFSRIGLKREIKMADAEFVARQLINQFAPEYVGDLLSVAMEVIQRPNGGHGRTLRKQLMLFLDLMGNEKLRKLSPEDVFRAAGTQLVNGSGK